MNTRPALSPSTDGKGKGQADGTAMSRCCGGRSGEVSRCGLTRALKRRLAVAASVAFVAGLAAGYTGVRAQTLPAAPAAPSGPAAPSTPAAPESPMSPMTPKSPASPAAAPGAVPVAQAASTIASSGNPRRDTLLRLMRRITVNLNETRLEDAFRFVQESTGANLEIMWADDRSLSGFNKDAPITLELANGTALDLIEKIIDKLPREDLGVGGATWQMASGGVMQIGPKERLNRFKRVEIYPVRDLLIELPQYNNAPQIDLESILQQGGGEGGGQGQSPFEDPDDEDAERRTLEERGNELIDILTQLVETEQWNQNGGDGATMRLWRDSLIVNGPDYVHRGLVGYSYWPNGTRVVSGQDGRRYVTLGVDTSIGTVGEIRKLPVTGVPGGGGGGGGGGGTGPGGTGPGGATPPGPGGSTAPKP